MDRRRCANPTVRSSLIQTPDASGPRCFIIRAIFSKKSSSTRRAGSTMPQIPHISQGTCYSFSDAVDNSFQKDLSLYAPKVGADKTVSPDSRTMILEEKQSYSASVSSEFLEKSISASGTEGSGVGWGILQSLANSSSSSCGRRMRNFLYCARPVPAGIR